jgi:hypothetical protein
MVKPLCVDLFCGLGGWSEGFLAEGYRCVGFDIERHQYGGQKYPGQLVIQDVLTLHGTQFRDAACIVASPPCQQYSWLAMPWSRSKDPNNSKAAKALRKEWEENGPDNRLFDACFRIQREAIAAAGRFIPLIVENVRGAQPWVGRSAWNFGSFHLWGDVPALMPSANGLPPKCAMDDLKYGQRKMLHEHLPVGNGHLGRNDGTELKWAGSVADGIDRMRSGKDLAGVKDPSEAERRPDGIKGTNGIAGGSAPGSTSKTPWFFGTRADPRDVRLVDGVAELPDGTKIGGDWFSDPNSTCRKHGSRSSARKAASAQIAKIPLALSSHIARVYKPRAAERVA